jgi:hypothetical protein
MLLRTLCSATRRLVTRTGASHTASMAEGYRVTEAMDGTFHVELWSARGGRDRLIYKTPGFQTREQAEAWIVPVEDDPADATFPPRSRVVYLIKLNVPILGINLTSRVAP